MEGKDWRQVEPPPLEFWMADTDNHTSPTQDDSNSRISMHLMFHTTPHRLEPVRSWSWHQTSTTV
jgi:hypothetical protein